MIVDSDHCAADKVGMIIPIWARDRATEYFIDNIHQYYDVIPGSQCGVRQMTDPDIFQRQGRYFYYSSREDLVNKSTSAEPLLVFTPLSKILLNISSNRTMLSGETIEEAFDDRVNLIMIYHDDMYHTISIEEAIHCWKTTSELVIPTHPTTEISGEIIDEIMLLCTSHADKDYEDLSELIDKLRREVEIIDKENMDIKKEVDRLSESKSNTLKEALIIIFQASMYLRGWDGTPGKYPLKSENTRPEWDVQKKASSHLIKATDLLKSTYGIFSTLRCYEHRENEFRIYPYIGSLSKYYEKVVEGNECIRVASKILCNSSAYYIGFLFSTKIDGYDHTNIEEIW
jgi:hypothetical protein